MRCFVAIEITDAIRRALAKSTRALSSRDVRIGSAEQLHVTLKFLGELDEARLPRVCDIVRAAAARTAPFDIEIGGLGCFPPRAPRVLWVGVTDRGECNRWVQGVAGPFAELGFAPETRAFTPHITLGRSRNRAGGVLIREIVSRQSAPLSGPVSPRQSGQGSSPSAVGALAAGLTRMSMRVEAITLFESRLQSDGATHHPLMVASLLGSR